MPRESTEPRHNERRIILNADSVGHKGVNSVGEARDGCEANMRSLSAWFHAELRNQVNTGILMSVNVAPVIGVWGAVWVHLKFGACRQSRWKHYMSMPRSKKTADAHQ